MGEPQARKIASPVRFSGLRRLVPGSRRAMLRARQHPLIDRNPHRVSAVLPASTNGLEVMMPANVGPAVMARETTSLIASDKVEGTPVRRSNGDKVGTIE